LRRKKPIDESATVKNESNIDILLESIWGIFFNQQKNLCKKLPHSGVA
jgi:hypothetical protein